MKKLYVSLAGFLAFFALAAGVSTPASAHTPVSAVRDTVTPQQATFIDLSSGDTITIWYDATNRTTYNKMNRKPVRFYVNAATGDTVYGPSQVIVNNYIIKENDSTWRLDENRLRITNEGIWTKEGNVKLKVDENSAKLKTDDEKTKIKEKDDKLKIEKKDKKD